jgi:DNA-binding NtrC family response regulator
MPKLSLLIVEDDEAVGLNLAAAAEDVGAAVVGPLSSVAEALVRLDSGGIDGAVIDVRLQDRDVTPVALRLIEKGVPFVIHSGYALPDGLAAMYLEPRVVMKPADPELVMNHVLHLVTSTRALAAPPGSALGMMVSALGLLDAQGERLAAVHLQTAIDVLTGEGSQA